MGEPLSIVVIGCGNISDQYLTTLTRLPQTTVVGVADVDETRATAAAERYGTRALALEDAYRADAEWICDLTTPLHHHDVALAAIAAGRCVYNEKPLCATTAQAREILRAARAAGVVVAGAPDTVLGTGIQTSRAALDAGLIGRPVSATATMASAGPESWHPGPDFYYSPGGGPLLDMGPYYVSALITLLGPIARVFGAGSHTRTERTIGSGPRAGQRIPVAVDTHITAILEHEGGALSTLVTSFDAPATRAANIEVHGEDGSLWVPDPNNFDGEVHVSTGGQWDRVAPSAGYAGAGRGIGLADAALSPDRRTTRASGEIAFHVLDVLESILSSAQSGARVDVTSTCPMPAPVPWVDLTGEAGRG